jgi:hypothetical protein
MDGVRPGSILEAMKEVRRGYGEGRPAMNKITGILCASLAGAAVLIGAVASIAGESSQGPRINRGRTRPERSYSVGEPGSIALLGAGLVTLGIYAKKKNSKKS